MVVVVGGGATAAELGSVKGASLALSGPLPAAPWEKTPTAEVGVRAIEGPIVRMCACKPACMCSEDESEGCWECGVK